MVFLLTQKNLTKMGISKRQSQQAYPFSVKILMEILMLGLNAIVQFIFLVHDASGFRECTESIYMTSIGMVSFVCFASLIFKMTEIYKFVDVADQTVEETKSKLTLIFYRTSRFQKRIFSELDYPIADGIKESIVQVEKWSRIIYFLMVKVTTVCGMSPKVIVSLYFFYAKDMGRDAFQLPVPMWYVSCVLGCFVNGKKELFIIQASIYDKISQK